MRVAIGGQLPIDDIIGRMDDDAQLVADWVDGTIVCESESAVRVDRVVVWERQSVCHFDSVGLVAAEDRCSDVFSCIVEHKFSPLLAWRRQVEVVVLF